MAILNLKEIRKEYHKGDKRVAVLGGVDLTFEKGEFSVTFQSYNLIPVLTVQENVELPLVIDRRVARDAIAVRALEVITAVGLSGMADRLPQQYHLRDDPRDL
jgi:ABC-type lipoprotein export system ATPase subunit